MRDITHRFILPAVLINLVINCDVTHHQRITKFEQISRECSDRDCGKKSGVVTSVRGAIDCARRCGNSENCQGFSVEEDKKCYLYDDCSSLTDCPSVAWQPPSTFYLKAGKQKQTGKMQKAGSETRASNVTPTEKVDQTCQNGGVWSDDEKRCRCTEAWIGNFCSISIYSTCMDVALTNDIWPRDLWEGPGKLWNISRPGIDRVLSVLCEVHSQDVRTMVLRSYFNNPLGQSWQDHVDGYYDDSSGNYWVGLDTLHELTKTGYNELVFETYPDGRRSYFGFHVGNSTTGYTLTTSSPALQPTGLPDLSDCLTAVNGTKLFSPNIPDRDHVLFHSNCTELPDQGWWFENCDPICNPVGLRSGASRNRARLPVIEASSLDHIALYFREYYKYSYY